LVVWNALSVVWDWWDVLGVGWDIRHSLVGLNCSDSEAKIRIGEIEQASQVRVLLHPHVEGQVFSEVLAVHVLEYLNGTYLDWFLRNIPWYAWILDNGSHHLDDALWNIQWSWTFGVPCHWRLSQQP
jgi:hypothetical protein